eukprot:TRINITY_DN117392_c0_g1_i1.p2 TRINITY_DN117392_c0_g1~~TRINITY_DN117392_c0_g1_i1.p2  ORF type:complete len:110 (+),score=9.59 TRINITY_DN117392_c0_g1_i1:160-489(+)
MEKLASTQRHMMRCMAGFVKWGVDEWSDMYRRVRIKLEKAFERQTVRMWADELSKSKRQLEAKLQRPTPNMLVRTVAVWCPSNIVDTKLHVQPKRSRGRPCTRWKGFAA